MKKLFSLLVSIVCINTFADNKGPYLVHFQDGKTEEYTHCYLTTPLKVYNSEEKNLSPKTEFMTIPVGEVKSVTHQLTDSTLSIFVNRPVINSIKSKQEVDFSKKNNDAWFVVSDVIGKVSILYMTTSSGGVYVDSNNKPTCGYLYREDVGKAHNTQAYFNTDLNPKVLCAYFKDNEELVSYIKSFKTLPPKGEHSIDFLKRVTVEYNQWYESQKK